MMAGLNQIGVTHYVLGTVSLSSSPKNTLVVSSPAEYLESQSIALQRRRYQAVGKASAFPLPTPLERTH
jgi:hypothetical protein